MVLVHYIRSVKTVMNTSKIKANITSFLHADFYRIFINNARITQLVPGGIRIVLKLRITRENS